jgi:putative endonuclease
MTNKRKTVLYTGVTNDLIRRIWEHKNKLNKGFTNQYNCDQLVYYEFYEDIRDAIEKEKKIKGGSRQDKINLINNKNPEWKDLWCEINQ